MSRLQRLARSELLLRLILIFGSAPAFFLALEAALAIGGFGHATDFFVPVAERSGWMTTNEKFGWRFFPPRIARTPVRRMFQRQKPPGVIRVFVLGESAALGFPDPLFSFGHQLEESLNRAGTGRFEVINAAMTAINSHVIREIAAECVRYQPDALLIYMGNNEVVGPYGAGTVFSGRAFPPWLIRAHMWVKSTRSGQLFDRLVSPQPKDLGQWRGMEMFLHQRVSNTNPRLERVYSAFRSNLEAICRSAAGAKVILSTVAVNLRDNPPFAGDEANREFRDGNFARARDVDELRFRADARINATIRDVARGHPGVTLVDAEALIEPSERYFYEHVHLKPEAHRLLASAFAEKLLVTLPRFGADPAWTVWDLHRMSRDMFALMERPPFTGQLDYRAGRTRRQAALAELRRQVDLDAAAEFYRKATARSPDDLLLRERFAELLAERRNWAGAAAQYRLLLESFSNAKSWHSGLAEAELNLGRLPQARSSYQAALTLDPDFVAALIGLGIVRTALGSSSEAEASFRRALAIEPQAAQAHNNLGRLRASRGNLDLAIQSYRAAVQADPAFATAHYNLASALARRGSDQEAIRHLRITLEQQPDFAAAHYDLGLLLARQGKLKEAIEHYRQTLEIDPRHADAYNNWGSALARAGRLKEAIAQFEASIRIDPNHSQARQNLTRARSLR